MSSHSNFSRLPLSKIVEIDRGTACRGCRSQVASLKSKVILRLAACDLRPREARELVGVTGVEPVTFTLSV